MPVLSKKALVALFFYLVAFHGGIQGAHAAIVTSMPTSVNTTSVSAVSSTAATTTMDVAVSSTPTATVSTPTTAVRLSETSTPAPTAAPAVGDDIIAAAAITIPVPVITVQTWDIKPTLQLSWSEHHTHEVSRVTKYDTSNSFQKGKKVAAPAANKKKNAWPAPPAAEDAWHAPEEGAAQRGPGRLGKQPVMHVNKEADANGYKPPQYNGPVHGVDFSHYKVNETSSAEGAAVVKRGEMDDEIPEDAGGPDDGRFSPKGINPVEHPAPGDKATTTVEYKNGRKVSTDDSEVTTTEHGHSETGSYSGLGAGPYLKIKKLLESFKHGKDTTAAAVVPESVDEALDSVPAEIAEAVTDVLSEGLNKTRASTKHARRVVKHILEATLHGKALNKTMAAHEVVKHILEAPATRSNPLRRVFEAAYEHLKKKALKAAAKAARKHMPGAPKTVLPTTPKTTSTPTPTPTTLKTVTRPHPKGGVVEPPAATVTELAHLPGPEDLDDVYGDIPHRARRHARRGHVETVDFTLHKPYDVTKVSTWESAQATQSVTGFATTVTGDWDASRYRAAQATARAQEAAMDESSVFDDPEADDEENEETHEQLREMASEAEEMRHAIDEAFADQFGGV